MFTLYNLDFMNHLWSLTNIDGGHAVSIKQLLRELTEWACVKHYGGSRALLEIFGQGAQECLNLGLI